MALTHRHHILPPAVGGAALQGTNDENGIIATGSIGATLARKLPARPSSTHGDQGFAASIPSAGRPTAKLWTPAARASATPETAEMPSTSDGVMLSG